MSTFSFPASPTTLLTVAVAGPVERTQSIRSCTSCLALSGPPGVHVKPGRATGSGFAARYESLKPASASALETGHSTGYGMSSREASASSVQSRYEGELKSPVRKTGMPIAASCGSSLTCSSMAGIRRRFSRSRTWSSV